LQIRIFLVVLALLSLNLVAHAQNCDLHSPANGIDVSVDENCSAEIGVDQLLINYQQTCDPNPNHYIVTLYDDASTEIASGTGFAILPSGLAGETIYAIVEYNVTGNKTESIPVHVFDKLKPTIACFRKSNVYKGALESSDPTYTRTSSHHPSTSGQCSVSSVSGVHYDVIEFTIDQPDIFTFTLSGNNNNGVRFFVALYENNFDPNNVCDNFLYDNYETTTNGGVTIPDIPLNLVHGKYFLVTTTVGSGQTGNYKWKFTSAQGGKVYTKKTNCNYYMYCFQKLEDRVFVFGNDNCDNPTDIIVTDSVVTVNNCDGSLNDNILKVLTITYVAQDGSGNNSDPLTVNVKIRKLSDIDFYQNIHFPQDRLVATDDNVSCSGFEEDPNNPGHPSPNVTGWPYIVLGKDTIPLTLTCSSDFPCNLGVTYQDMEFNTCPKPECKRQFKRTWTISEGSSCSSPRMIMEDQKIEIADTLPPVVTCPDNQTVNTNQFNCVSTYTFPVPDVSDNCQSDDAWDWDITIHNATSNRPYKAIIGANKDNPPVEDLDPGVNEIKYTVTDGCGNKTECQFNVTVEDKVEPVAVCQTFTTVALTYDGEAQLPAFAVNSGSYDNCSVVELKIKRMDSTDDFAEYVTFTCDDMDGQYKMVILQVSDAAGNVGTCMVSVEIQDKLPPSITCPDNEDVDCDYIYEPDKLTKYFGWPTAHDNCNYVITTDSTTTENACYSNPVKVITRHFTATDAGGRTAECTQTIEFNHNKYFGFDDNNQTNENANGDITWPLNKNIQNCTDPNTASDPTSPLHPNQTGWPVLDEEACDQVGFTYSDFIAVDNDNDLDNNEACFKIIRTWTVIDDCHKEGGKFVRWEHDQVILVTNDVDPTMDATPDIVKCTYDTTCTDGHIDLLYTAHDDCTQDEDLRWRYYVDLYNDNSQGTWDKISPIHAGNNIDASGDYPIGTHKIVYKVWDQCGNSIVQEQLVTIQNCKKPTPVCIDGLVINIDSFNTGGPVAFLRDTCLNKCSYHTCDYPLVFSFSSDTSDHVKWFGCNEIGTNQVELWVTALLPDNTITQDYCITTVEVQDNNNECGTNPLPQAVVSGTVNTTDDEPVKGVSLRLIGSELGEVTTDENGKFSFESVDKGKDYKISFTPAKDYMNGVSTLDLVMIQKHILGRKKFNSEYDYIAADANNDSRITSSDILLLRKLILGVSSGLPANKSWKYIDAGYEFNDKEYPFDKEAENLVLENLDKDVDVSVVAVKIGDVNGDAIVNDNDNLDARSDRSLVFAIKDLSYARGEEVLVPVLAKDFDDIQGFQGTFAFDNTRLQFEGIEPGVLEFNQNNYADNRAYDGFVPVSWYKVNAVNVDDDAVLFVLRFKALKDGRLQGYFNFNSGVTRSEAYNSGYEKMDVKMQFRSESENAFELLQNTPNPFSDKTNISFVVPEQTTYTLNVFDMTGKLVYKTVGEAQEGVNNISLDKYELDATGILYYTLIAGEHSATKKMIVIK